LVVLLAAQLTGVTWLGLQAISKTHQTCRNARQNGVVAALKKLPKGKGNCAMCKKIRLARAKQAQQQRTLGATHDWSPLLSPAVLPQSVALGPVARDEGSVGIGTLWFESRSESPPTPPPKA